MRLCLFLIPLAMSSAGCTPAEDYDEKVGVDASGNNTPSAVARADATNANGRTVSVENELMDFSYAYPAAATDIEPLAAILDRRAETARSEVESLAEEDQAGAAEAEYEYRRHSFDANWKVVADLPGWLSLNANISTYTGGAHPNHGYDSLLWDKRSGEAVEPLALFRSASDLQNAIGGPFCAQLNEQRERRRGQPIDPASEDPFDSCPTIDELTVLLGSSNGETFDRIGLLAAPYVAGPYAEGSYEFTVPVTTAVLDAIKPEYLKSFSLGPRNSGR